MGRLPEGLWPGVFLPEEEAGYLLSRVSLDSGYRHSLEFLSTDPQVMFSRLQITMGGVVVEDIQNYNRLCCFFNKMQSQAKCLEMSSMVRNKIA